MNFPNQIIGTFNRNITLQTGFITVYKDDVLFLTFTESDIVLVDNVFTIDVTNLFPDYGSYYINMTEGLFIDSSNELSKPIYNNTDWAFTIGNPDFKKIDFNNLDFKTQ